VAVSQLAAAQASSPASLIATGEAQQRHDLASAAAVAVESAAEVLSDGNGGEEAAGQSMLEEQEAEMAGEEREAMQQELRAEAASAAEDEPALVVEQDGTTALPALAVVKGAGGRLGVVVDVSRLAADLAALLRAVSLLPHTHAAAASSSRHACCVSHTLHTHWQPVCQQPSHTSLAPTLMLLLPCFRLPLLLWCSACKRRRAFAP
jgi:hypothetical protein